MAEDAKVALLGTGIMGAAMARNLIGAGMEVRAWNRSAEKAEPLAGDGATVAEDPAQAANGANFLLTMLPDADVIEEVVGDGALSALSEGAVWLQMSTVGEGGNERLARLADENGVAYVDAPVLGTKAPAEQGQLVVLASGPEEVREKCEPVFGAVGSKTVWLGEAGEGSRLKLVVNNWIVGLLGVLAETISFARATGVDPQKFLETIEGGPLGLPYAQMKGAMMIDEDFPTSFS
ncbi:MAG: 3-hydroxyisobutyrate dehydrogenase family protein, partial [uncultured Rubrobacteraceae bacterium]